MTPLTHFMTAATAILDEQDRKASRADQPPFFTRTTWLFAGLAELALPREAEIFTSITVARLSGDIAQTGRLVDQVHACSGDILDAGKCRQRMQICGWIKEQIRREGK